MAISGEHAARSRNYGERKLFKISHNMDAIEVASREAKGSVTRLLECAKRLIALMAEVKSTLSRSEEKLPYLHRCALIRCQMRLPALFGSVKKSIRDCYKSIPNSVDSLTVAQLEHLLADRQFDKLPLVETFNISNFKKVRIRI